MLSKKANSWLLCSLLLIFAVSDAALSQSDKDKKDKERKEYTGAPVLWADPLTSESRNLLLGAGGESMKPDLKQVTFIEQKQGVFD